jgi:hypothetical protein
MKMTIYLPDDLAKQVKKHTDLNVSAVCQGALRRELTHRDELAKLEFTAIITVSTNKRGAKFDLAVCNELDYELFDWLLDVPRDHPTIDDFTRDEADEHLEREGWRRAGPWRRTDEDEYSADIKENRP